MIKRFAQYFGPFEERQPPGDYWVVTTPMAWYAVTRETADELREQLEGHFEPRWLRFRDIFGAEAQIRAGDVLVISESTGEQRAGYRALGQALEEEADSERRVTDGRR